ncbi:MAG: exodeoxyribonuclease VII small subunit [Eggerthellaceae bacterium]|nr:exodeoxyribonuclease VII small subunit [Eggerthellaceae bacterium]
MAELPKLPKNLDDLSFRDAMAALDDIVALLESNTLELEDSLIAYEQGVGLLRNLRSRLENAQQKVDVLMGELEETESDEVIDSTLQKA